MVIYNSLENQEGGEREGKGEGQEEIKERAQIRVQAQLMRHGNVDWLSFSCVLRIARGGRREVSEYILLLDLYG